MTSEKKLFQTVDEYIYCFLPCTPPCDLWGICGICDNCADADLIRTTASIERNRLSPALEAAQEEIVRLNKVILREVSENDEIGAEYTYVRNLREELVSLNDRHQRLIEYLISADANYKRGCPGHASIDVCNALALAKDGGGNE